jgi:CRISPR-associated protein Csb2
VVLEVRYLQGALRLSGRGAAPSWPPDPGRLFAALVHAWGTAGEDPEEEAFLRWLEGTPPPRISAPELGPLSRYRAYVPVNHVPSEKLVEYTPAERPRVPKDLVEAPFLGEPVVRFHLAEPPPPSLAPALERLLRRVGRLGNTRNPVLVRLTEEGGQGPLWVPGEGGRRLGVWYPGYLEALRNRHRRLYALPERLPRGERAFPTARPWEPLPMRTVGYVREGPREEPAPFLVEPGRVLALAPAPPLALWPPLAQRLRTGLPSEALLLPLPFLGFPQADGRVMGVTLAFLPGLPPEGRERAWRALLASLGREVPLGFLRVALLLPEDLPRPRASLDLGRWLGPARRWRSATPVVWEGRGDPEESLKAMLGGLGLPPPVGFRAGPYPFLKGAPGVWEVLPYLPPSLGASRVAHLALEVPEPLRGPLVLGLGRELGLGLLLPEEAQTAEK